MNIRMLKQIDVHDLCYDFELHHKLWETGVRENHKMVLTRNMYSLVQSILFLMLAGRPHSLNLVR